MTKRELILEAVIALSDRVESPNDITVSAVAEEADVGKGTVYEYFSSKTEMITEAVAYFAFNRLEPLLSMEFSESFYENFKKMMEIIAQIFRENRSFFRIIFLSGFEEEYLNVFQNSREEFFSRLGTMLERLVDSGKKDGIVNGTPSQNDLFFAFFSVGISSCCITQQISNLFPQPENEDSFDFLYRKFITLLN